MFFLIFEENPIVILWEEEEEIEIVAKASDGQRYPMPLSKCWFEFEGERGSGPEGVADVHIDGIDCPGPESGFLILSPGPCP